VARREVGNARMTLWWSEARARYCAMVFEPARVRVTVFRSVAAELPLRSAEAFDEVARFVARRLGDLYARGAVADAPVAGAPVVRPREVSPCRSS
jgi:hypothetical protein